MEYIFSMPGQIHFFQLLHFFLLFFFKSPKNGFFETLKKCPKILKVQKRTSSEHGVFMLKSNISKFDQFGEKFSKREKQR